MPRSALVVAGAGPLGPAIRKCAVAHGPGGGSSSIAFLRVLQNSQPRNHGRNNERNQTWEVKRKMRCRERQTKMERVSRGKQRGESMWREWREATEQDQQRAHIDCSKRRVRRSAAASVMCSSCWLPGENSTKPKGGGSACWATLPVVVGASTQSPAAENINGRNNIRMVRAITGRPNDRPLRTAHLGLRTCLSRLRTCHRHGRRRASPAPASVHRHR